MSISNGLHFVFILSDTSWHNKAFLPCTCAERLRPFSLVCSCSCGYCHVLKEFRLLSSNNSPVFMYLHILAHYQNPANAYTEWKPTLSEGFGLPKSLSFILAKTTSFSFGNCPSCIPSSAIWVVNQEGFSTSIKGSRLNSSS